MVCNSVAAEGDDCVFSGGNMTFGFSVRDETGKTMFTPNGECYVFYAKYNVGAGAAGETKTDTGISVSADPQPLFFVISSYIHRDPQVSNIPLGELSVGNYYNQNNALNHVITASGNKSVVYVFMPGWWVERKYGSQKWGARFYDENGKVSWCGWQKPLQIAGYIPSDHGSPHTLKTATCAVMMRSLGHASLYVPSIDRDFLVKFHMTASAMNGRTEQLWLIVGRGGGSGAWGYTGDIPYIDSAIYE